MAGVVFWRLPESPRRTDYLTTTLLVAGGVLIAALCALVFRSFLEPVVWATVLALVLHPLYRPLLAAVRSGSLAALLLCLLGAFLLSIPFYWVASLLPAQVQEVYGRLEKLVQPGAGGQPNSEPVLQAWAWMADLAQRFGYDLKTVLNDLLRQGASRLIAATPGLIGGLVHWAFDLAIVTMTLFFFLRDGERLVQWLRDLVPLGHTQTEDLFGKIRDIVRATVLGGLAVAAAQGFLGGLLFWALGLPTPLLWGIAMGLLALVPLVGSWLVWAPAGIALLWQGHVWRGAILLGGGLFGVSTIDNILRPLIIGQHAQMPTLLIFFSILGGVEAFGAVGLIVGPVLVALLVGILDFTRARIQSQREG
jgi:predicted PurR-regulated permease PerM